MTRCRLLARPLSSFSAHSPTCAPMPRTRHTPTIHPPHRLAAMLFFVHECARIVCANYARAHPPCAARCHNARIHTLTVHTYSRACARQTHARTQTHFRAQTHTCTKHVRADSPPVPLLPTKKSAYTHAFTRTFTRAFTCKRTCAHAHIHTHKHMCTPCSDLTS